MTGVPTLSPTTWSDPRVQALSDAQQAELRDRYDGRGESGTPPTAEDVAVVLLLTEEDGTPVGCGALRPLEPGVAELKRMYVAPPARGRGLSRLVLTGLEDVARERGWGTLRLETGPLQHEAIALYERSGYRPIEAFGHYRDEPDEWSRYYEKELA
ncbi:GNAT family N-acetyltransferase [Modestobacter sp. Leaf380]|uniref:GNAT family N-acetyltransferase n=1 Tax=Modestobacter sp. Leaf380 TaxID=1736356 RepID=UPI0006F60DE0|nr:GNAT family N-acetyltransferase [Modestobacter sp. Leaf380]KQS63967.1 GCN5 family acetyltransferase [Modestobacter sp. Leaf380]